MAKNVPPQCTRLAAITLTSCLALGLSASLLPAQALPSQTQPGTTFGASRPAIPSAQDIENAKQNEGSTAAEINKVEGLISAASEDLQKAASDSYRAADSYSDSLVALTERQATASNAQAKADAAATIYDKAREDLGDLAGEMYKTGGMNVAMQTLLGGDDDALHQASTLQAVGEHRAQTVAHAQLAANTASTLQEAAQQAQQAADEAADQSTQAKDRAEQAYAAQNEAVTRAQEQRSTLIGQLATLKNSTVALETARIEGLERQRQQEQLATIIADSRTVTPPAPNGSGGGSSVAPPAVQPPVVQPPAVVTPPTVQPPVVQPPTVQPPIAPPPPPVQPPVQPPVVTPPPSGTNIQGMVNFAMSKVGSAYVWGGTGPGYDCSGLIWAAFRSVGVNVPRTGSPQFWNAPQRVPVAQAQYGDILAFNDDGSGNFSHVGIYIGNNKMVNALNPQQGVLVVDLNDLIGLKLYPLAARY
ncbi:C40 family peptidase [Acaricomes phytoseiuli]|uniref:C40 family peptidase n=1 Tax=Acaricomes phytoseiuli TaxID=291968 RepID=UPI000376605C|nr:C40 family peptidase [Acaricomes phytoseiuli]MCW1250566.1 C40 family peptidase [Acaricomes phytoseiuli]